MIKKILEIILLYYIKQLFSKTELKTSRLWTFR